VRAGAPRALLHTDAVAAVGWRDVAGEAAGADLVSISAHKFGGPKGTGALVVRHGTRLAPVLHGGPQERGRRPGTPDVAGAVGMAAALSAATAERAASVARVGALRDRLLGGLVPTTARPGLGAGAETAAYSCHVCIDGVDNEELVVLLDDAGVCASAGAACASGALEASHVLSAMGVDAPTARSALRLSLGYCSTDDDVEVVLAVLPKVVEQLRS